MPKREELHLWRINDAVMRAPSPLKDLLIAHYTRPRQPGIVTCRALHLRFDAYPRMLADGRALILASLERSSG